MSVLPICTPVMPPVRLGLLNTVSDTTRPKPSVTIASVIPRVLSAGIATSEPMTMVTSTATAPAGRNAHPSWDRRPAISAAIPASPNCARHSCPL